jgi:hypothetical protein
MWIARRKTPFVLTERTGGAFSGTAAVLRYRYLAASCLSHPIDLARIYCLSSGHVRSRAGCRTFLAQPVLIYKGAAMTQADHYRDQSNRARQLAEAVKDPEASKKLIEMAEEFRLYAERLEETH